MMIVTVWQNAPTFPSPACGRGVGEGVPARLRGYDSCDAQTRLHPLPDLSRKRERGFSGKP